MADFREHVLTYRGRGRRLDIPWFLLACVAIAGFTGWYFMQLPPEAATKVIAPTAEAHAFPD